MRIKSYSEKLTVDYKQFILISALFLMGASFGVLAVGISDFDVAFDISEKLGFGSGFVLGFFELFKLHLLVFIFGLSPLGIIIIPALSALKGFTLSFSSAFLLYGIKCGSISSEFLVYLFFQLISTVVLFPMLLGSMMSASVMFKGVFSGREPIRRAVIYAWIKKFGLLLCVLFMFYIVFYLIFN